MIVPVELALPCRLVRLDLRVGPEEGITAMEDLVARAIVSAHERTHTMVQRHGANGYLAWLFAVPERVIVDVIGSLWSKGYVTVDFDSGAVALSTEAMAKLSRGESLAAEGELQVRDFLFEPITGMILPERLGRDRSGEGSIQLPVRDGVKAADIPPIELVRSVQAALRYERARTGRLNVQQVGFGSPLLREPERIRWLHIEVAARRDPENNRISVEVDEKLSWPARAQQQLGAFLNTLADDEPGHPVVQELRGRASIALESAPRLDDLIRRMGELTAGLAEINRSELKQRHKVLGQRARQIRQQLAKMRDGQALTTLVSRPEGHTWALNELVEQARSQLVLVAPSLDYNRTREALPGLRKALDRGVRLFVMWGRAPNDKLSEKVGTLLDELQLRPGAEVVRAPRSSQTEACIVVADDCRALVCSHSVLGGQPPGSHEPGVLIEPAENGPSVPRAVTDLLRWARDEFPRWSLGQRIELSADEEAPSLPAAPAAEADELLDAWETADLDMHKMDDGAVSLWASRWAAVHATLAHTQAEILTKSALAEVVRDGEHRTVLWEELRGARRRLVLADDRVGAQTVRSSLVRAIKDSRDAGATVFLTHPALPEGERATESIASLRADQAKITIRLGANCGRVVVGDDEVLIGSFSPLGDVGGSTPGRRISQLGIRIRNEALAAETAALIAGKPVGRPSPDGPLPSRPNAAGACALSSDMALSLLLEARTVAGPREFGRVAADRIKAADDPFAVLNAWDKAQVDRADLRAVVAVILSDEMSSAAADSAAEQHTSRWFRWLVEDAWRRGAFVEAAVLAARLPEQEGELRAAALLAAAIEAGPLGPVVEDCALVLDNSVPAQLAGVAGALAEVLRWEGGEARDVVGLLSPYLPPHWAALCAQVEGQSLSGPVPFAALSTDQTRADTLRELNQQRAALVKEIDKIAVLRNRFSFNAGHALHDQLFASEGLLTRIRTAAGEDNEACRRLMPDLPEDVRGYLNRQIAAIEGKQMEWLKHVHFLHQIEDIVRSIRGIGVMSASGFLDMSAGDQRLVAECAELGAFLAEHWDGLYAEAKQQGPVYELPALALLNLLNPLAVWAVERS